MVKVGLLVLRYTSHSVIHNHAQVVEMNKNFWVKILATAFLTKWLLTVLWRWSSCYHCIFSLTHTHYLVSVVCVVEGLQYDGIYIHRLVYVFTVVEINHYFELNKSWQAGTEACVKQNFLYGEQRKSGLNCIVRSLRWTMSFLCQVQGGGLLLLGAEEAWSSSNSHFVVWFPGKRL